jgi:hypothetical protein
MGWPLRPLHAPKLPVKSLYFLLSEQPLSVKADGQDLAQEFFFANDRKG